jgi:hypothetical protein
MYFGLGVPEGMPGVESRAVQRKRQLGALSGTAVGGMSLDILLAVRRLVVQGGSTALEQLTKKPGFFC